MREAEALVQPHRTLVGRGDTGDKAAIALGIEGRDQPAVERSDGLDGPGIDVLDHARPLVE